MSVYIFYIFLPCPIHIPREKKKLLKSRNRDCFQSTQEIANQINGPCLGRRLKSSGTQRIS